MSELLLFLLLHAVGLLAILTIAAATGVAVLGNRFSLALRMTTGLAVFGNVLVLLGVVGQLRLLPILAVALLAVIVAMFRWERASSRISLPWGMAGAAAMLLAPVFLLSLYPPLAFDETLYHLPFVQSLAAAARLSFQPALRFPVFPQLQEMLCVPLFLTIGDTATHLIAFAEVILLAALMLQWPRRAGAGPLAAALCLGSPIVAQIASVTYVEAAMMLFAGAGFFCLDRLDDDENTAATTWWYAALAGLFLGTACSVKYLGLYFVVSATLYLMVSRRWRQLLPFLATVAVATLPTCGLILANTGNPVFPFLSSIFGESPWTFHLSTTEGIGHRLTRGASLLWDITFDREKVNSQPPYSPLVAVAAIITMLAATRNRKAALVTAGCVGYVAVFTLLTPDSRYLLALVPLVSVIAASALHSLLSPRLPARVLLALSVLVLAPAPAYAGYRLLKLGPLPVTGEQRRQFLEKRIPEYRALEHRDGGLLYVCGAEQLQAFGGGTLRGDVFGPWDMQTLFDAGTSSPLLANNLSKRGVRELLISHRACRPEWQRIPSAPEFALVFSDAGADLWRIRSNDARALR